MSEKPEPMLRHFFGMLVDENTVMLDPTCGSGSALRAAESVGAKYVLGIEANSEFAALARTALKQARALRAASAAVNDMAV
jgi:predicted RNA methylase